MNYRMLKLILTMFFIFFLVVFFNDSVLAGGSFTFKWGQDTKSEQPQVKPKQKKGGPPAHAPAHGYRAKRQYQYYPSNKIYYDNDRGLYFYLKGDNWEVGASLPSHLRADLGESVTFEMETDKPYVHNADHVKKYPSKKSKGNQKKNWAKKK